MPLLLDAQLLMLSTAMLSLGIVSVDLVFDYSADRDLQEAYYRTMLPSPVATALVPACMAVQAISIVYKLVTEGSWRWWALLAMFVPGAPYFELVVKPAQVELLSLPTKDAAAFDARLETSRVGHLVLYGLLLAAMAVLLGGGGVHAARTKLS